MVLSSHYITPKCHASPTKPYLLFDSGRVQRHWASTGVKQNLNRWRDVCRFDISTALRVFFLAKRSSSAYGCTMFTFCTPFGIHRHSAPNHDEHSILYKQPSKFARKSFTCTLYCEFFQLSKNKILNLISFCPDIFNLRLINATQYIKSMNQPHFPRHNLHPSHQIPQPRFRSQPSPHHTLPNYSFPFFPFPSHPFPFISPFHLPCSIPPSNACQTPRFPP